jgi:hypothetical protein
MTLCSSACLVERQFHTRQDPPSGSVDAKNDAERHQEEENQEVRAYRKVTAVSPLSLRRSVVSESFGKGGHDQLIKADAFLAGVLC